MDSDARISAESRADCRSRPLSFSFGPKVEVAGRFTYSPPVRDATSSFSATLSSTTSPPTWPRRSNRSKLPTVTSAAPYNGSNFGRRTTNFTAPLVELRPYSVPCGPRSTSMRSKSLKSSRLPICCDR